MTSNQTATGYVLVTGGVGFIGTNLVQRLAQSESDVVVFDNFSRPGVLNNARWLSANFGNRVRIICGDVRNAEPGTPGQRGCAGSGIFVNASDKVTIAQNLIGRCDNSGIFMIIRPDRAGTGVRGIRHLRGADHHPTRSRLQVRLSWGYARHERSGPAWCLHHPGPRPAHVRHHP